MSAPVSSDHGRGFDGEDDEGRDPKRLRTSTNSSDSNSESSSDDESAEMTLEQWIGQCYEASFTAQQILDAARENLGDAVADNHVALHNVRLAAAMEAQQPQVDSGQPVITVEIDNDQPDAAVQWETVQPGTPEPGVQYAPIDYEDWEQAAQADTPLPSPAAWRTRTTASRMSRTSQRTPYAPYVKTNSRTTP